MPSEKRTFGLNEYPFTYDSALTQKLTELVAERSLCGLALNEVAKAVDPNVRISGSGEDYFHTQKYNIGDGKEIMVLFPWKIEGKPDEVAVFSNVQVPETEITDLLERIGLQLSLGTLNLSEAALNSTMHRKYGPNSVKGRIVREPQPIPDWGQPKGLYLFKRPLFIEPGVLEFNYLPEPPV